MSKLSLEDFLRQAINVHGTKYEYDVATYDGSKSPLRIQCPHHGWFEKSLGNHISGKQGCPTCARISGDKKRRKTLDQFINEAKVIHGDSYHYDHFVYQNASTKSWITCPTHGKFEQTPDVHVNQKCGCPECGKLRTLRAMRLSDEEILNLIKDSIGSTYDTSLVKERPNHSEIPLVCDKHGKFVKHLEAIRQGHGCSECSKKFGKMQNEWLRSLGVDQVLWQKRVYLEDRFIVADAFDPNTNTVYEFWGDYHHGNPKVYDASHPYCFNGLTMGELYEATLIKIESIKRMNYNLVQIWESEWKSLTNNTPEGSSKDAGQSN